MARFELTENDRQKIISGVSCALILEREGYALDKADSTRNCLKYRRGKGEIIIVKFEGQGWWDPGFSQTDPAGKGDVFSLLRRFRPGVWFRDLCVELGGLIGLEPEGAVFVREQTRAVPAEAPAVRWAKKRILRRGTAVWSYLTRERCLPDWIVRRAITNGCIRDGYRAAWFAHHDANGQVCGAELRGPDTHLCISGSVKTLFRFKPGAAPQVRRLVVCEAAIDALSAAALDPGRTPDTLYVSTAGGMGAETIDALRAHLQAMRDLPGALLVVGTDDDEAGNRYADRLYDLAGEEGVDVDRLLPPDRSKDFNQTLKNLAAHAA
ncbi:DUF3991 domain-containing protein [Gluconacetobacter diazotrophicus]|uniref:DUF3991 domain-containing protein n=1 Tax=Gluconacetobacter diazotrophicus TaxID=33996 RepID=A0A7W4I8D9_GLUDI|nr:DUF3991 and TOPRIM domain-containing protein [Gluconacetobacter diazotrophicus]MBB2158116.1 DUF3991 domain-containing protein [Gluconacetobacter diazotrophicus]